MTPLPRFGVSFGTTWQRALPAWVRSCVITGDRLTVVCDLDGVTADRRAVSISTARWRVEGRTFQTLRAGQSPGVARIVVSAMEVEA